MWIMRFNRVLKINSIVFIINGFLALFSMIINTMVWWPKMEFIRFFGLRDLMFEFGH